MLAIEGSNDAPATQVPSLSRTITMGNLKDELPVPSHAPHAKSSPLRAVLLGTVALALTVASFLQFQEYRAGPGMPGTSAQATCKQADPLVPSSQLRGDLDNLYTSSPFLTQAAEWLGGAVRVP